MKRALYFAFALAAASAFSSTKDFIPSLKVEPMPLGGLSSLSVSCDVRGADVWLDYQYRGQTPLDLAGLAPGAHLLSLRAPGYYDAVMALDLAADTKTSVRITLKRITGYLDIRVSPSNATVLIDGNPGSAGINEVATGLHEVTVKAFGYKERTTTVLVPERLFVSVDAALEPAPFDARGFSVHASRFNPRNAGLKGSARIFFTVTAPGSGEVVVRDAEGRLQASASLGPFSEWDQSYAWDGRGDDGAPLPDGDYTMELTLKAKPGLASVREAYAFSAKLSIDSGLVVATSGAYGAMYGSEYAPEALAPAVSAFRVDAMGYLHGGFDASTALSGGVRLSLSGALAPLFDMGIGFETDGSHAASRLGLRVSAPMPGLFGLAGLLEGRIAQASEADPAFVRAGLGLGLGTRFINAVLSPHVGAYWAGSLGYRAGLGAAITVGGFEYGASLSALAMTGELGQTLLAYPVKTALELRFAPPRLALSFRLIGGLEWSPSPSGWSAGFAVAGSF